MVAEVDIANRALSQVGTRSTIASLSEISNEADAVNLWFGALRDELLRTAPWNCAKNTDYLSVLKSAPGTPENSDSTATQWVKATMPPPPWAYSYGYPQDCLRPLWVIPQIATAAFPDGIPITTAVTGGSPSFWNGPAIKFAVAIDQDAGGNDMRVILTNQPDAILTYIKRVTNPDVWDQSFDQAFVAALAGRLTFALTGDKKLANMKLSEANIYIEAARVADGNEGLTINDHTPDWIRVRGIAYPAGLGAGNQFDWGASLSLYS